MAEAITFMNEKPWEYFWESARLKLFKTWPFSDNEKCNKQKMAEAGFYWVGSKDEPDAVQCFLCNKQLDGWESGDDPWHEHNKHANKCQFVRLGKAEENITLYEMHDILEAVLENVAEQVYKKIENEVTTKYEETLKILEDALK